MKNFMLKVWNKIRENSLLKITSLFIAIFLWIYIASVQNPLTTTSIKNLSVDITIDDTIPASEGLILMQDDNISVDINVEGKRQDIANLKQMKDKIKLKADFSKVTKSGVYSIPVKAELPMESVKLAENIPDLSLKFDKKKTVQLPIKVMTEGNIADNYIMDEVITSPSFLEITGPSEKLDKLDFAQCNVKVEGLRETFSLKSGYVYIDKQGNKVDKKFITNEYEKIDIKVPVLSYKSIPVLVELTNSSGGNESSFITSIIEPSKINIAGNADVLSTFNSLKLDAIDMATVPNKSKMTFDVVLPNDIKNVDNIKTINVSFDVKNIVSKKINVTNFDVINAYDGQKVTVQTKKLEIEVRGTEADINKINENNVKAIINLEGKKLLRGNKKMPVVISYPTNSKVGTVGKYTAVVRAQ